MSRAHKVYGSRFRILLVSISLLSLAACSDGGGASSAKTSAPMPPIAEMDAAMSAPVPQPQPLQASDTLTPVTASTITTTSVTTTAPTGAENIEERIARLEANVGTLRTDYDRIMPAFASLNTTNERIQTILDGMDKQDGIIRSGGVSRAPAAEPVVVPVERKETTTTVTSAIKPLPPLSAPPLSAPPLSAPPVTETVKTEIVKTETVTETVEAAPTAVTVPTAPSSGPAGSVIGVRIGEHASKTRVVMDLTGKTKPEFKYDLDNGEKLLVVDMPSLGWTGAATGKGGKAAPLVAGWNAQKGAAGGSTVAIQLKKNARILSTQFLPPEGKDPARLVMDIAAGS